jgi:alpha-D-xyloside xylohydrolase
MDRTEMIYGLGMNTKLFDMTGKRDFAVVSDEPENETNESHAPVPFYVSSRGFGVFVDTARFASFYTGNLDPTSKSAPERSAADQSSADNGGSGAAATGVEDLYRARELRKKTMVLDVPVAQGVDVYVFSGPTMLDAVRRYNLFSGGGCVPPLWGLGIAYRGLNQFTGADSLNLAKSFRDQHIPCDIWGLEPGWQTHTYSCSFVWNRNTFPDPDAFVKQMADMGFHLNLWEHCFTHPSSPIHDQLIPYSGNFLVWGGLVPDFSMRQARDIFLKLHEKEVFSKGVSGVKLDECDYQPFRASNVWSFPECSEFPSGMDGEQMHSMLGVLYQQTMLEPFTKRNLRTWGLVRSSHALAASLPYTIYSDSYDHKCYVRGMCKSGFCGVLWTPEVRNADSVEEFFRRTETVIFSPFAQIDSWFLKLPPWIQVDRAKNNAGELMPDHEAVTATTKKLLDLRMSLIPYLYSAFNEYHLHGTINSCAAHRCWWRRCSKVSRSEASIFPLVTGMISGRAKRLLVAARLMSANLSIKSRFMSKTIHCCLLPNPWNTWPMELCSRFQSACSEIRRSLSRCLMMMVSPMTWPPVNKTRSNFRGRTMQSASRRPEITPGQADIESPDYHRAPSRRSEWL